eukprot:3398274-Heterocapsa_arctica.AAC.1
MTGMTIGIAEQWPADIRDEIAIAALLLPFAVGNLRWPVSPTVTLTDATPSAGGAVACLVSQDLSEALYDACEMRGEYICLDDPLRDEAAFSSMTPPNPDIDSI